MWTSARRQQSNKWLELAEDSCSSIRSCTSNLSSLRAFIAARVIRDEGFTAPQPRGSSEITGTFNVWDQDDCLKNSLCTQTTSSSNTVIKNSLPRLLPKFLFWSVPTWGIRAETRSTAPQQLIKACALLKFAPVGRNVQHEATVWQQS